MQRDTTVGRSRTMRMLSPRRTTSVFALVEQVVGHAMDDDGELTSLTTGGDDRSVSAGRRSGEAETKTERGDGEQTMHGH